MYTTPSTTAGPVRDRALDGSPGESLSLRDQIAAPVLASTLWMYPPQSGKYAAPPAIAAVAETSPWVVYVHLTFRSPALLRLSAVCGLDRVFDRSWPAVGHGA